MSGMRALGSNGYCMNVDFRRDLDILEMTLKKKRDILLSQVNAEYDLGVPPSQS